MGLTGYYLISDTCPDLYTKIIKKITAQLKKDRVPFTIVEIRSKTIQPVGCRQINVTHSKRPQIRKSKACDACAYQGNSKYKGREDSDFLTIITIKKGWVDCWSEPLPDGPKCGGLI